MIVLMLGLTFMSCKKEKMVCSDLSHRQDEAQMELENANGVYYNQPSSNHTYDEMMAHEAYKDSMDTVIENLEIEMQTLDCY